MINETLRLRIGKIAAHTNSDQPRVKLSPLKPPVPNVVKLYDPLLPLYRNKLARSELPKKFNPSLVFKVRVEEH
jgi:hypothetical protein